MKRKRVLKFSKSKIKYNQGKIKNDNTLINMWITVADTVLVTTAYELAKLSNVTIEEIGINRYDENSLYIVVWANKKAFITFCIRFCKKFMNYIENIEF